MRHPLLVFLVASAGAWAQLAPVPARADSSDPSELFLNAYLSVQAAEKLEADGSYKAALSKYRYAGSLLDQLRDRNPSWQPLIVDYRKKKTSDAIEKLEQKLALEAPPPAPVQNASPAPALDLGAFPNVPDSGTSQQQATKPASANNGGHDNDIVDQAARQIRDQMAELKRQLQDSREQLEAVQKEKASLANKLDTTEGKLNSVTAAARQQANAQGDLKAQAEEAKAAAAKAVALLERAKGNETTLQASLDKAQQELRKAQDGKSAQNAATEAANKQIAQLKSALEDAKADREVAEEQGEILSRKVVALSAVPNELKESNAQNLQLAGKLAEAQNKIDSLTDASKKIGQQLEATQADKAKLADSLADAEKKLVAAVQERDAAQAQSTQLSNQLADSKKQVASVSAERDAANKQRDDAIAQLAKAREAKGQVDKLVAENGDLMKKLDDAQKAIASFNSAAPQKDKEIGDLKAKIASVQDQLAAVQKDSANDKNYITELQAQLDSTTVQPQGPAAVAPEEQKKVADENQLLRGIVMRELKDQARREQVRKLVVAQLSRLQIRSQALNEQVDLLSQPVVKLTDKERALFKTPQMEIIDNESSSTAISIPAPQSDSSNANPKAPSASGTNGVSLPTSLADLPAAGARQGSPSSNDASQTATKSNIPSEFQALAQEAKDKLDHKQYVEAERSYEKLISKLPSNVYALSNLGVAQFRAGQVKTAEETFKKVIAISPTDSFAYSTLGILYYGQKKFDEAINAFTRSLASNPKNATAHNYLGVTAAQKGWQEAAQKEIETAIQLEPNYGEAHFNLAVVLTRAQPPDMENARKHYKRALELGADPDPKLEELMK